MRNAMQFVKMQPVSHLQEESAPIFMSFLNIDLESELRTAEIGSKKEKKFWITNCRP